MSNWYDSIVTAISNAIEAVYVKKISGKSLSTNDFSNTYKAKLDALPNKHITNIEIDNDGYLVVTWYGEQS
jgi:hypothetical protein